VIFKVGLCEATIECLIMRSNRLSALTGNVIID
jgi:hypothetical protein